MKITLQLDDDLAQFYEEEAKERTIDLPTLLADRLARAGQLDPRSRYIILTDRAREQVEEIVGGGSLVDGMDLLRKVSRLARIKFGDHEIRLTPSQLEEMAWRAKKQGKTIPRMLEEIWMRLQDQFFTAMP